MLHVLSLPDISECTGCITWCMFWKLHDLLIYSDGQFPYSKSKIEIFSQNRKNRNLDFITSLCIDYYWHAIHLYSTMITWRHVGKPKIVAVINNPILRASLQIRQLLTGRTAQGERSLNVFNRVIFVFAYMCVRVCVCVRECFVCFVS